MTSYTYNVHHTCTCTVYMYTEAYNIHVHVYYNLVYMYYQPRPLTVVVHLSGVELLLDLLQTLRLQLWELLTDSLVSAVASRLEECGSVTTLMMHITYHIILYMYVHMYSWRSIHASCTQWHARGWRVNEEALASILALVPTPPPPPPLHTHHCLPYLPSQISHTKWQSFSKLILLHSFSIFIWLAQGLCGSSLALKC